MAISCPSPGPTGITVYNPTSKVAEKWLVSKWHHTKNLSSHLFRISELQAISNENELRKLCSAYVNCLIEIKEGLAQYWKLLESPHAVRVETNWIFNPHDELSLQYAPLPALSISKPSVKGQLAKYMQAKINRHLSPLSTTQNIIAKHFQQSMRLLNSRETKLMRHDLSEIKGDILHSLLVHSDAIGILLNPLSNYVPPKSLITYHLWVKRAFELTLDPSHSFPGNEVSAKWGLTSQTRLQQDPSHEGDPSGSDLPNPLFERLAAPPGDTNPKFVRALRELTHLCELLVKKNHQPLLPQLEESLATCIRTCTSPFKTQLICQWLVDLYSICIRLYFDELHTKLSELSGIQKEQFAQCYTVNDFPHEMMRHPTITESVIISAGNDLANDEVFRLFGRRRSITNYFPVGNEFTLLPELMFGIDDLTDVSPLLESKKWPKNHLSRPSIALLRKVIEITTDVRNVLCLNQHRQMEALCKESLFYHFYQAFKQQPHLYLAFDPKFPKYHLKKCLIIDCSDSINIPGFDTESSPLPKLMKQYLQGHSSAALSDFIRSFFREIPLWLPIKSTPQFAGRDQFSTVAGICTPWQDRVSEEWKTPNRESVPSSFRIFVYRYMNHMSNTLDAGIPDMAKLLKRPLSDCPDCSNFTLSELYRTDPSKATLETTFKRAHTTMEKFHINLVWNGNPTDEQITEINTALKTPHAFWTYLALSFSPKVIQAWRFCRLHYDHNFNPTPHPVTEEYKDNWSRNCALDAIKALFTEDTPS